MIRPAADLPGSGRLKGLAIAAVLALLPVSAGAVESADFTPTGLWQTTNDVDGEARGLVRIAEKDGIFSGTVVVLVPGKDESE